MEKLDFQNLSQAELSQLLGVDRTTIRSWTRHGLPYREPETKGGKGSYCASICIHWRAGHKFAEARGVEISPLHKVAIGWYAGNDRDTLTKEDSAAYLDMMASAGVSGERALRYLEFARGALSH
jgi:phage terminase Nu1 subunit (DNA packaging protein)